MHILLTVNAAWNILNFRKPLVQALIDDGHELTILAPRDDAAKALEQMGCNFVDLKLDRKGLNPAADSALIYRFYRHFRKLQPDRILSFTIKNNVFGAFAARLAGIAFIPNVTGLGTAFLSSSVLKLVSKALYRTAFASVPTVFFQNDDDSALFVELDLVKEKQVKHLPGSGIDLEYYAKAPYPGPDGPIKLLMIARLLRDKGLLEFVDAAKSLQSEGRISFQLLGGLDPLNRSAISQENLDSWVGDGILDYLGTTDDVRPFIEQSHCVVLPSYREGAPRTLIEAASIGRPLITTDVPGCRTVVEHDYNGLLCEVRSASSLREAITIFLSLSHESKRKMASASRVIAEQHFDVDLVINSYRTAISDIPAGDYSTGKSNCGV